MREQKNKLTLSGILFIIVLLGIFLSVALIAIKLTDYDTRMVTVNTVGLANSK